jgi:hypothetical protein
MDRDTLGASFIIRIWIEETVQEAGIATWRGQITHVPSGSRRYVEDLAEIGAFIAPYLGRLGVQPQRASRVQRWLRRLKKCLGASSERRSRHRWMH